MKVGFKLEHWLTLAFFGLTVTFIAIISVGFYTQLKEATLQKTQDQLASINILKKRLIEQQIDNTVLLNNAMSVQALESIMRERTGMGATGESYLVGEQKQMLTTSRFFPDTLAGAIMVDTKGVRQALAGYTGVDTYPDYRGIPVVGAYRPVSVNQLRWALLTEVDMAEAMTPVIILRNRFAWVSGLLMLLSLMISIGLAQQISRPIQAIQQRIQLLGQGTLLTGNLNNSRIQEINRISASANEWMQAMQRMMDFAQEIGQGNFEATYQPLSGQDALGLALIHMRDQLAALSEEKDQWEVASKRALLNGQETERERIARDIHDGIGPLLTTAKLRVSMLPLPAEARQEISDLLSEVIREVRRISSNLMPAVLRDFGLGDALQQLVRQMRPADVNILYTNDLLFPSGLGKETSIALYRVAQEGINNALKHAQAQNISLSLTEFDDQVMFYLKDDGVGFDTESVSPAGNGLKNIRERIRILGGTVTIHSNNTGTVIEAEIPLT